MSNFYRLLDAGNQRRLEQWGDYILIRPEPSADWPARPLPAWHQAQAIYQGRSAPDGHWQQLAQLPPTWTVTVGSWQFQISLGSSKHVGLFPEQLPQWQLIYERMKGLNKPNAVPRVLNLFAYTGAGSIAAATAGAFVTHVDSSSPAIGRAKVNQSLNGLSDRSIRWIRDDARAFVRRELRREAKYELILMDPPAFGHGAHGEQFSLTKELSGLLKEAEQLLSPTATGILLTTYTNYITPTQLAEVCRQQVPHAAVSTHPLELQLFNSDRQLTLGSWAFIQLSGQFA